MSDLEAERAGFSKRVSWNDRCLFLLLLLGWNYQEEVPCG